LLAGVAATNTQFHDLCHSGRDEAVADQMQPLMQTDSERLMRAGIETATRAFESFLDELGWERNQLDKTFCHQVGVAHRKLLFEAFDLSPALDFSTVEFLGNTGSVAVPITAAMGIERGHLAQGDRVAMLGIGSGINVLMLGVDWQRSTVASSTTKPRMHALDASRGAIGAR
jgi:3-oxoacyl-[acyl-carrier-protein] synthase-3